LNNFIISVDGPAGSGKQKIAKYIAKKYKLYHLDSGVLYRRLAFILIKKNINYKNEKTLNKFIKSLDNLSSRSHLKLRAENISIVASKIAIYKSVRKFINLTQKKTVKKMINLYRGCVVDGRDIGSKVFKSAKIKLFITVNNEIRAKRRHKQLIELGEKSIYAHILKDINLRDKADINRKESPLIIPKNSIIIDNSKNFKNTLKLINKALIKIK